MKISKIKATTFTTCFSVFAAAQSAMATTGTGSNRTTSEQPGSTINLQVEANVQFHSLATNGNTMFGPTLLYGFTDVDYIGGKGLVSVGNGATYTASILYRRTVLQSEKSSFFVEPSFSYSRASISNTLPSAGLAVGFSHQLLKEVAVGGVAGFESYFGNELAANVGKILAPKAAAVVNVAF